MTKLNMVPVAVVIAAAGVGAQASEISYEFNLPVAQTTSFSTTGNLPLFDSSMGTLTGARIDLFGEGTFKFNVTKQGRGTAATSLTPGIQIRPDSSLQFLHDLWALQSLSLGVTTGVQTYTTNAPVPYGPLAGTDSLTYVFTTGPGALHGIDATNFQAVGGGQFSITGTGAFLPHSDARILLVTDTGSTAGMGARITYTYDPVTAPVPEPASALMALAGLALVGGVATVRRRQA